MSFQVLSEIVQVIHEREISQNPNSYVFKLLNDQKGIDKLLEKLGEESVELIIALKNGKKELIIEEAADLLFHFILSLYKVDIDLEEVMKELEARRK